MNRDRKLDWVATGLMLPVLLAPWLVGFSDSSSAVANHIAFALGFGPLAMLVVVLRPAAFALLIGGAWLVLSPWLLGYAADDLAWLSELVSGASLMVVGAAAAGLLGRVDVRRNRSRAHAAPSRAPRGVSGAPTGSPSARLRPSPSD
jgi:hypothetical protein